MIRLIAVLAAACLGGPARAEDRFSKAALEAQFYYDLGDAEVDVSSYAPEQRKNYLVFKEACFQCHTLARVINSPLVKREDWSRYVKRMHIRTKVTPNASLSPAQAKAVLSFLAYDAQKRKVERKAAFEARDARLRALFEEARKERTRLQIEEDRKKARQAP